MGDNVANFDFNWKFQDFEIRTTHTYGENPVPYVELVKWDDNNGKRYCYTLAYWHRDKDGFWELRFVGDRPLRHIAEIDVSVIWKQLFLMQQMFLDAESKCEI